ncbi:olfactory receptor 140-like [Salarias fasciatus]|uniref:olfactory receptor 140-like n=1 Tax=Salarias fasciatus TaxID=181472 RepID=UPI001176A17D|nr:olfactory receptor 140-like [Salarias fasciatus]
MSNVSGTVLYFSLSGFSTTTNCRAVLFSLTLLCYFLIVFVNMSLILTIIFDRNLHEPMYIFLGFLCFNGLYGAAGFYPKFAFDLLSDIQVISYEGCLLQVFVIYSNAKVDYSILVVMAYDRYVAICRPLEHHSVMSVRKTAVLVSLSWIIPLCSLTIIITLTSRLKLCGSQIDKLYCENWSLVKLACGSTKAIDILGLIVVTFYICHFLCITLSYTQLVKAALNSKEGRKKFIQTCMPHLFCLFNVTTALLFDVMYSRYGSASMTQNLRNFMAVQFLVFPQIMNPVIYGLILTKVRNRMMYLCLTVYERLKSIRNPC